MGFFQLRADDDDSIPSELIDALRFSKHPAHLVAMSPKEFANG